MTSPAPSPGTEKSLDSALTDAVHVLPSEHPAQAQEFKPDARFWLVFLAICFSLALSALDLTAVSTILPSKALCQSRPFWS